jgi:hypothetical protein
MYQHLTQEEKYYTVERLMPLNQKVLDSLSSYEEGVTVPSPAAKVFLAQTSHKWTKMAQANAAVAAVRKRNGDSWGVANIEESVWPKGGQVVYSAKEITVIKPNGDETKVLNNPIPLPPGSDSRTGIQTMAVAISSLMDLDRGNIVLIKPPTEWMIRFPDRNYPINPAGVIKVKAQFCDAYDPIWKTTHMSEQLTLKGQAWVQFLMPFLMSIEKLAYWKLVTVITTDFFNVVRQQKETGSWILNRYTGVDGKSNVFMKPEDLSVPSKAERAEMRWPTARGYPAPIVITGPVSTLQYSPASNAATFKTAVKVMTESMGFRGGTSRGLGFLCSGLGFAGLPSVTTRRLVMELSLVLPILQTNRRVVLKVNVCDIPPLYNAVLRWTELFKVDIRNLQFLVPVEDLSKVHKDCKPYTVVAHQPETFFVWLSPAQMPTVKESDETGLIYDAAAEEILANIPKTNFIVQTPVFSTIFFSRANVFSTGNVWDFRCIITDQTAVYRAGVEQGAVTSDVLAQIKSASDLWPQVVRDNGRMIGFLMSPRTSYHSSMNLLQKVPKAGALQQNSDGVWEFAATAINEDNDQYVREVDEDGDYAETDIIESDDDDEDQKKIIKAVEKRKERVKQLTPSTPGFRGVKERDSDRDADAPAANRDDVPPGDMIHEDADPEKLGPEKFD